MKLKEAILQRINDTFVKHGLLDVGSDTIEYEKFSVEKYSFQLKVITDNGPRYFTVKVSESL